MSSIERTYDPDIAGETITYLKRPTLPEYFRTYRPHALQFGAFWLWAQLVGEDGSTYFMCREINKDHAGFLLYFRGTPGTDQPDDQILQDDLYKGYILHFLDEETQQITIRSQFEGGNAFKIEIKPQLFRLDDANGKVDLTWTVLPAPAQEWYVPGHTGEFDDYAYRSEHGLVEGVIEGVKVSGWGGMDVEWLPVGVNTRQTTRYEILEKFWLVWYTEYEDGTIEDGVYVRGFGDHVAPYYYRDGKAYIPKDTHVDVVVDDGGLIESAAVHLDDLTFDYKTVRLVANDVSALDDGQQPDEAGGDMAWTAGVVVNRAIDSPVKRGWATPEYKAQALKDFPIEDLRLPRSFGTSAR